MFGSSDTGGFLPARSEARDGVENGRAGAHPWMAELGGYTHERPLKLYGEFVTNDNFGADLAPDRMPGEERYSGRATVLIWAALIGVSWVGMAGAICVIASGLDMVLH